MGFVTVSSKGQITLPAKMRKQLGIRTMDRIQLVVRNHEIVIKPLRSFRELRGTVSPKEGDSRRVVEKAVAKHVLEDAS